MDQQRLQEIRQILETAEITDNSPSETAKTEALGELLAELEQSEENVKSGLVAAVDHEVRPEGYGVETGNDV